MATDPHVEAQFYRIASKIGRYFMRKNLCVLIK